MAGKINSEQPARTKLVGYPGRMMLRDIKRRTLIRQYWPRRFRYQLLRKNMIFPDSFKVRVTSSLLLLLEFSRLLSFLLRRITVERKSFQHSRTKRSRGGDGIAAR